MGARLDRESRCAANRPSITSGGIVRPPSDENVGALQTQSSETTDKTPSEPSDENVGHKKDFS